MKWNRIWRITAHGESFTVNDYQLLDLANEVRRIILGVPEEKENSAVKAAEFLRANHTKVERER